MEFERSIRQDPTDISFYVDPESLGCSPSLFELWKEKAWRMIMMMASSSRLAIAIAFRLLIPVDMFLDEEILSFKGSTS